MKSINQFDYPSKDAQCFKGHSQLSDSLDNKDYIKARYKENLQYHMELERNKVKQTEIVKKQQESKRKKQQLESELEKKKRQLENLEILKVQAEQNQKKAHQLAALKQEQDLIKKQEEKRRKIQFDEDASIRFSEAMKKLHEQKQEQSFKERLAEQRRKTAQQFQKLQRLKAEKFRQTNQQKQRVREKENNLGAEEYKKTFKQFFTNPNKDYNRTCVHNLKVVSEIKKEQENAIEKGKLQQSEIRERSQEKRRRAEQNDRRSKERGREALIRIQREREYESFEKETTEEQKKYNLERIEAGKKNQFVGVKPTTLSQMQVSKKIRSEEEFDKMFFSKSVQPVESANRTATKFEIVQKRIPQRNNDEQDDEVPRKINPYLRKKQESQIPAVSEGKYSFEEKSYSDFKNQSRSQSNIHSNYEEDQNEEEAENEEVEVHSNMKNNHLKETRIPGYQKTKDELPNFKNSEPKQAKFESSFKKDASTKKPKVSDEPFDTNAMLKKYGLSKETGNEKPKGQTKNEGKRKVVQLSNICQNKQPQKEELNYSSESEQDSLS